MIQADSKSNMFSNVSSTIHPCPEKLVAIGHTLLYYAQNAMHLEQELNIGTEREGLA